MQQVRAITDWADRELLIVIAACPSLGKQTRRGGQAARLVGTRCGQHSDLTIMRIYPPLMRMSFKAALNAMPSWPSGTSASMWRAIATPRSPSILRTIVSAVGKVGGWAAAMGNSADPAASFVGGLILTMPLKASSASAAAINLWRGSKIQWTSFSIAQRALPAHRFHLRDTREEAVRSDLYAEILHLQKQSSLWLEALQSSLWLEALQSTLWLEAL